jgi:hypothetical protein
MPSNGVPLYFFATYEAFAITFEMKMTTISIQKLNKFVDI